MIYVKSFVCFQLVLEKRAAENVPAAGAFFCIDFTSANYIFLLHRTLEIPKKISPLPGRATPCRGHLKKDPRVVTSCFPKVSWFCADIWMSHSITKSVQKHSEVSGKDFWDFDFLYFFVKKKIQILSPLWDFSLRLRVGPPPSRKVN